MNTTGIPPCPAILIERICAPIREWGLPTDCAAALAGIDPDLWAGLCLPGTALALAVRQAEACFMLAILKLIFGPHVAGQPKVNVGQLRTMLERRFPDVWGRKSQDPLNSQSVSSATKLLTLREFETPFQWPEVEAELPATEEAPQAAAQTKPHPEPFPRGNRHPHSPWKIVAGTGAGQAPKPAEPSALTP